MLVEAWWMDTRTVKTVCQFIQQAVSSRNLKMILEMYVLFPSAGNFSLFTHSLLENEYDDFSQFCSVAFRRTFIWLLMRHLMLSVLDQNKETVEDLSAGTSQPWHEAWDAPRTLKKTGPKRTQILISCEQKREILWTGFREVFTVFQNRL